jgi:uroporphyrinogen-III decarboxylase
MLTQMEPVLGEQDMGEIARALGDRKSFHAGLSAPHHLGGKSPDAVKEAVRKAFETFGHRGFMLGCSAGIRPYFPWENIEAMIDEW